MCKNEKENNMSANLPTVILWADAAQTFETDMLPALIEAYSADDTVAFSEAWNDWTDSLCKDGQISDWQYANWSHPACCG
jgi:hypothetical protein